MVENVEFIDQKEEQKEVRKGTFRALIDGTIVTNKVIVRQLPYILFLTLLALIYIANRYHAERIVRETTRLKQEVKELRAESISTSAELMFKSSKTQVLKAIKEKNLGLKESRVPPRKIIIKDK